MYLKHFVKILSNRYQSIPIFDLFSSESYSGHVGDCFLESGRQLPYLEAIFLVEKEIYIPNSNFASGSTCLTARKSRPQEKPRRNVQRFIRRVQENYSSRCHFSLTVSKHRRTLEISSCFLQYSPVYFYAFPVDAQLVLNSFKTEMYQLLLLIYKYAHIVTV